MMLVFNDDAPGPVSVHWSAISTSEHGWMLERIHEMAQLPAAQQGALWLIYREGLTNPR